MRLERAVAAARQNRNRVTKLIGEGEIEPAVPIEIARGHCCRSAAGRIVNAGLKRPVAFAQQDRNRTRAATAVAVLVGHGEIKLAICVKVARGYGDSSARLQRILFEIFQRAAARAQQY